MKKPKLATILPTVTKQDWSQACEFYAIVKRLTPEQRALVVAQLLGVPLRDPSNRLVDKRQGCN
jgi:hypothetical protein